ncbi:MAG: sugar kinase [Planctomyces sp.]|nr:sugar kinase [Planctomyces sp.]MBA4120104.1 sugar kinase [Isosphaera sp.]
MTRARQEIAATTADKLMASAGRIAQGRAVVGFDAFIDAIIRVVDRRGSMRADDYTPIRTIAALAGRIGESAGLSTNLELSVAERRFGGNGPLMASGLAWLGAPVTYIGAVGREDDPTQVHPLYRPLEERCARVVAVGTPATTDALEFDDGKVMLGKPSALQHITWEHLKERIGLEALTEMVQESRLIGIVNWVMMGGVEGIWKGLYREVLPRIRPTPEAPKRVFIDLCDPAKRADADIRGAVERLAELNRLIPVTLGLNLAEARRMSAVLGVGAFEGREDRPSGPVVRGGAESLRRACGLDCVVIHPRHGAAAATESGQSGWIDGPLVSRPRISTGAGDHFNAGFALAQSLGLAMEDCLCAGVGTSGVYVRDGQSPTLGRLVDFLRRLPEPESA